MKVCLSLIYPVVRSSALSSSRFCSTSVMSTFLRQAFLPLREEDFLRFSPFPVGAGFSTVVDIVYVCVYVRRGGREERKGERKGKERGKRERGSEKGESDECVKL